MCMAFEISAIHALPAYRYFLLDLTKSANNKYISELLRTGQMNICLLSRQRRTERSISLLPSQCLIVGEWHRATLEQLRTLEVRGYDFERAVTDFERSIRIPELFERVISEADLPDLLKVSRKSTENTPAENRALAKQIVTEFVQVLSPHSSDAQTVLLKWFPLIRQALLLLNDLFRLYATDSAGFIEFLGDVIASRISMEELNKLSSWPKDAAPIFQWLARLGAVTPPERAIVFEQMPAPLKEALQRLASGQGLSLNAVKNLLPLFGIPIGGQPGRPPKDYSEEYDRKASGDTWGEVAQWAMQHDDELHEEFGGRDYASLDFRQQEALKHRIEVGVKSYAKRIGKPLPPAKRSDA